MAKITRRAIINEIDCIGCNRCVSHCPVDCIIGAPKMLHNILTQECIGCGLCIEPCPVDCISLYEDPADEQATKELMLIAKQRHKHKVLRQKEEQQFLLTYQSKEEQAQIMQLEISSAIARQKDKSNKFKIYGSAETL